MNSWSSEKLSGRRLSQPRKKLIEVVQLDDVTVNRKLAGSRSSKIITGSRYKHSEVVQLTFLTVKTC